MTGKGNVKRWCREMFVKNKKRCPWAGSDPLYLQYHDTEWGVPLYDEDRLFEFLILEGAQAGLSWLTILKRRGQYRNAFDNFQPRVMARYPRARIEKLMGNKGIIRNRLKIESAVSNARAFLAVAEQFGSFSDYIWRFVDGRPLVNQWRTLAEVPAQTPISAAMSADLKKRGFKFVGPTICYAFMQAVGMVNDHLTGCFRHPQITLHARR